MGKPLSCLIVPNMWHHGILGTKCWSTSRAPELRPAESRPMYTGNFSGPDETLPYTPKTHTTTEKCFNLTNRTFYILPSFAIMFEISSGKLPCISGDATVARWSAKTSCSSPPAESSSLDPLAHVAEDPWTVDQAVQGTHLRGTINPNRCKAS